MKAISIRQPWAWLIVNGYKDIENRSWRTKYRGQVLIHASQGVKKSEYERAKELTDLLGITLPTSFETGGIVGVATITDCVEQSESPWFFGEKGFVLTDARPLKFIQMKGKLSFFETGIEPEEASNAGN
ncbi:ASCH domain-containing protein [Proteus mirabilis]|uniref:ASCH domain-containing protein n=1 Tax=Proteus mirabilis TaxID=584 RepID=UPI0029DF0781|nr:ASCH domain-containing protein [Proteus mirabilis]WSE88865.1 ASCH domain-containing protein [Proteus mirabilis]HEK0326659.1 ASCH domain-containing protein [Proteus mirabilis]HEK1928840.1 ASCH domain-containing protein [Proteus mirabilis]HEK1958011.1 ASCH domain-containing protein [Proteus mirabilis]